jgi:hypothetical protein
MALGKKTGGRKKGIPNKATAEIKAVAQQHGEHAIQRLVALSKSKQGAVAVAACKELLDRGYGKATQSHEHAGPGGGAIPVQAVVNVYRSSEPPAA